MTPFRAAPAFTASTIASTIEMRAKLGANTAITSTCRAISATLL